MTPNEDLFLIIYEIRFRFKYFLKKNALLTSECAVNHIYL